MSTYRFADSLLARWEQTCMTYTIAVCTVKNSWWWTEELSETCVEFYSKNKFEKLMQLVGFIIRIYRDTRSPERQFIAIHGHLNVNLSRYTVTWTSIYRDTRSPERQTIKQVTKHTSCQMLTPTCFDTKVPSSGRLSTTRVFRSNSYFSRYSPSLMSPWCRNM